MNDLILFILEWLHKCCDIVSRASGKVSGLWKVMFSHLQRFSWGPVGLTRLYLENGCMFDLFFHLINILPIYPLDMYCVVYTCIKVYHFIFIISKIFLIWNSIGWVTCGFSFSLPSTVDGRFFTQALYLLMLTDWTSYRCLTTVLIFSIEVLN